MIAGKIGVFYTDETAHWNMPHNKRSWGIGQIISGENR